ncbi:MAG: hypothetical protein KME08_02415 [Aphanothece sp. CMT-3BRIN-NPC111]|jgi:hypothetical protein|nr:hypothetical protein [Aphanothece sp. CMT-3BRIN-NPC111]
MGEKVIAPLILTTQEQKRSQTDPSKIRSQFLEAKRDRPFIPVRLIWGSDRSNRFNGLSPCCQHLIVNK